MPFPTEFALLHKISGIFWSNPASTNAQTSFQIRNSYDYHLNEIFATVQNEYSDLFSDNGAIIRELVLAYREDFYF